MKNVLSIVAVASFALSGFGVAYAQDPETLDIDHANRRRMILHVCKLDGTPVRPLVANKDLRNAFDRQGTPDTTTDGKLVVYDAWKVGGSWQDARIILVNMDGTDARDLCDGVMPCFSPDGKKLVISRSPKMGKQDGATGQSIWVMNIDGSGKKMIADQGAQGARWSPDGKSLVFFGGVDEEGNPAGKNCLRIYDFETEKVRFIFTADQSPFKSLIQHFDWPKSKERLVAFGGQLKKGGMASAVVNVDQGPRFKLITDSVDGATYHGLSVDWHPGGKHLLVTGYEGRRFVPQWLAIEKDAPKMGFAELPGDVSVRDPIVTPDGQFLIASLHAM